MKNKRGLSLFIMTFILLYIYMYILKSQIIYNSIFNILFLLIIFSLSIYIIYYLIGSKVNSKSSERVFKSLIKNSDTVYLLISAKNNDVLYLSDNVDDILGITDNNIKDLSKKIFNIQAIKSELNNWNKSDYYISQLLSYDNPKYNHEMWIKIKAFPFKEQNQEYYSIQILDATKEHDRQHLLIRQASDIKIRETQLNQITKSTYDLEININISNNSYELKYFKNSNQYFGEEKRGFYTEGLKEILKYINESDRDLVKEKMSFENLKRHFEKYEMDSISLRYRLGNEVKNNVWLESTIFFLSNKEKNTVSILTKDVSVDAKTIKEQNVLLQNALNEAKNADKAKLELIQTISYDVRSPLTNVLGLVDDLLTKDLDKELKSDIKNIKKSSSQVLNIIDGLLDVNKIEQNIIRKEEKNYNILKMFKILEDEAKDYIGEKNIKLNLNLDKNLPVILYGDYKRITKALSNIINNSIKFTDEGEIFINVKGKKKDDFVNLTVEIKDTGIGIKEDKLNIIMNSNDTNTGLGTVKRIMELLDGKFEIESLENEYTNVTISFKQKIVEDNKVGELLHNNKVAEVFDLSGNNILVVDDNELNLKVTKRLLSSFNLNVVLLSSGEECLSHIKEGNIYDLILLDQMMPGLDGIATLTRLKEIENFNTPVVVLTADAFVGQKEKYLASGFDDYVSKPIDKKELSRVLKKFIKNK